MFNMGANHRIGPRRINVKLARVLAARGVSSLRFDLGGVGDSETPTSRTTCRPARCMTCRPAWTCSKARWASGSS
jgi:hypothetical protein